MKGVYFFWGHPFQLQSLRFGIRGDKLIHVHEAATNSADQLIVHDFSVDLFRAEHVPAFTDSANWDLAILDVQHRCEHLVDTVALGRSILAWANRDHLESLFNLGSRQIQLVIKIFPLLRQHCDLRCALLNSLFNQLHLYIVIVERLKFYLVIGRVLHDQLPLLSQVGG